MAHPQAWDGLIPCHVFEAERIVWVEVPKAASTSIKIALANALRDGSFTDDDGLHQWFGYTYASGPDQLHQWLNERWAGWWRFTVVRDPIERFASLYREKIDRDAVGNIDLWVAANADSWWWEDIHAVPQTRLVGDPADYDFVGRVEHLSAVATAISEHVGQPITFGHHNRTELREPMHPATLELLRRRYAADLAAFGYEVSVTEPGEPAAGWRIENGRVVRS